MRKLPVNYQNQKEYVTLNADVQTFLTACTSIIFHNQGTVAVTLTLSSGKGAMTIEAGQAVAYNNNPDVMENNQYAISFAAGGGTKKLFVTKEHVTRVFGGESEELPSRNFVFEAIEEPAQQV